MAGVSLPAFVRHVTVRKCMEDCKERHVRHAARRLAGNLKPGAGRPQRGIWVAFDSKSGARKSDKKAAAGGEVSSGSEESVISESKIEPELAATRESRGRQRKTFLSRARLGKRIGEVFTRGLPFHIC